MDDFESLYESHLKSQRGVIWKDNVAWFSLHGIEEALKLSDELEAGEYKPKPPVTFTIYKPKQRDILAIAYRDRVYQRSINDNILYPTMTRSFVKENGACQTGRGTDYCLNMFRKNLRRFYINHNTDGYFLQLDVKKYYPSMQHDVVKAAFRKKLDDNTYNRVADILDGQYKGDVGYNPGSQMVQIAGISLLDGLDHFIKEKLHIKNYIRVMDDMVVIHESKEYLEYCRDEIKRELAELHLKTHPDKTLIVPIKNGITFLGFDWRITDTGKVLQMPKSQTIKEFRHKTIVLLKMYANGKRTRRCVEDSVQSRLSFIAKGTSHKLVNKLQIWYQRELKKYEGIRSKFLSAQNACAEGTC